MKKELDEAMYKEFPAIFRGRHGDMRSTAMMWGFEIGDGWEWLIRNLCKTIQGYIDNNSHRNIPPVIVTQVKEKYGTLRFYFSGGDEHIDGMVWFAEHLSYHICEECGSQKRIGSTGHLTLQECEKCGCDVLHDESDMELKEEERICSRCLHIQPVKVKCGWLKTLCYSCAMSNERWKDSWKENCERRE